MASKSYALRSIRPSVVQAVTLLLCFGSGALLDHVQHLGPSIVVLTTVLGMTLGRTQRHGGTRQRLVSLATLPIVSIACNEVGRLFIEHPNVADVLFTAALGLSIWIRRFGGWASRLGTLIALPFIALLVTPVPVLPGESPSVGRSMLWSAVAAVIAFCWVWAAQEVAQRIGYVDVAPAHASAPANKSNTRIPASTRMAVQMTLSLALAFVIGRSLFPTHWTWIVVTAFIVNSGNRGRGDVVYKCLLRIAGAAVGTVMATLVAGLFPPRDNTAIVIILVVLAVGSWLRTINYAYWAGCVTSVLSLLQGYFGEGHVGLIGERLLQIVLGGALAVAVAWFVLPVKSSQVLRRRIADSLAELTDALYAAQKTPEEFAAQVKRFGGSLALLEQVSPSITAHRRLHQLRGLEHPHPADAVDALRACAEPMSVLAEQAKQRPETFADPAIQGLLKAVLGNVVGARRFIGGREGARYREPRELRAEGEAECALSALYEIDDAARVVCGVFGTIDDHDAKSPAQPLKA
jgi:Fusaric acid resistance protein-like